MTRDASIKPYRRPTKTVPLLHDGCLLHWAWAWFSRGRFPDEGEVVGRWAEPFEFNAILRFDHFDRGRSACTSWWHDALNPHRKYPMFLTDMHKVLTRCEFQTGNVVDGLWGFRKHGANFGITPILPEELPQ